MKQDFFINNRRQLMSRLLGSLIVVANYFETQRRHDESNMFVSESNFWYLSGIDAPTWRLIIDAKLGRTYAVYPSLSEVKQIFDGGWSAEDAKEVSGVDEVISADEADSLLLRLRREHRLVYMVKEADYIKKQSNLTLNRAQKDLENYLSYRFEAVHDARSYLQDMRAIKYPEEVAMIKKAATISAQAYSQLADGLSSMKYEYEVEALLNYEFRRSGGDGPAYHTIAASGKNACTLHYTANNDRLSQRSVLLIDAAASYNNYSADITRCVPIGKPTNRQEAVYQALKQVFDETVKLLRPGLDLRELQTKSTELTQQALRPLGLEHDESNVMKYFPHAIGHSLGLDTHDTFGSYHELKAGMVLTIEPGIYIKDESIGVRYEDDFLITATGSNNLSDLTGDIWYNKG